MSDGDGPQRLDQIDNARLLLDRWTESLAQVLESMTDQRPEVQWKGISGALPEVSGGREYLWWEQPFQVAPQASVWVGAPAATWESAGTLTLKAAGVETVETGEARDTWIEILGQSLSVMARAMGTLLGREVTTDAGAMREPDPALREWASVRLTFGAPPEEGSAAVPATPPLLVALSAAFITAVTAPRPKREEPPAPEIEPAAGKAAPRSRTMDLLLDVDLPVSISFGKALMPMKDVLKLTMGSIVELNRSVNEPVEVLVNQCLIARGEVVVVEGNYGVRIQEIASRQDRLRSLR